MSENITSNRESSADEGGLRAPPGLSSWGKVWWWFHFLILVKLARLRFIAVLLAIGLVIVYWETLVAYYDKWTRSSAAEEEVSGAKYYCPMHTSVVRDNRKEKCPICNMPLTKIVAGTNLEEALRPGVVNRVQLSPYRVVLAGIKTQLVEYVAVTKEIMTVGFVEFDERTMKHVAARVKGRIDKLVVNETGQPVEAGDILASLYSPDLIVTVQNLLDAKKNNNPDLLRVARDRLSLWGISDDQIDEILRSGQANTHLNIRSPITGHVLKKYVKEGQYVDEGSPLYDVVDLTTVWIQGQVYEDDMAFLPTEGHLRQNGKLLKGLPVAATTRAWPNETFKGRLTFIYPHVDQDTRTVIVRIELPNHDHKLRPGTSASVKLNVPVQQLELFAKTFTDDWHHQTAADVALQAVLRPMVPARATFLGTSVKAAVQRVMLARGQVLAVPDTAVIDTGRQQIVYREAEPGVYEGVKVELGPRMVGADSEVYYPVLRGLEAGEKIVTAGSFLVDAETRLNPAAGSIYFGGSAGSKSAAPTVSSMRPSTPEDMDAKIKTALAKLPAEDRLLAEAQDYCPVRIGSRLGSMDKPFKMMIQNQPVFLCCKGCESDALANPKAILAKVAELKKAKAR